MKTRDLDMSGAFPLGGGDLFKERVRSILTGLHTPLFFVFFSLTLLELYHLHVTGGVPALAEIVRIVLLHLVVAFLYPLLFHLFYSASRFLAVLMMRMERVLVILIPALSVFLLFVEPLFRFTLQASDHTTIPLLVTLVVAALSLVLLYLFPLFRGQGATFLAVSVVVSRILFLFIRVPGTRGAVASYSLTLGLTLFLTFLIFAVLHARYRLFLADGYEKTHIPLWVIWLAPLLFLVIVLLFLWGESPRSPLPGVVPESVHAVYRSLYGGLARLFPVYWLLSLQWVTSLVLLRQRNRGRHTPYGIAFFTGTLTAVAGALSLVHILLFADFGASLWIRRTIYTGEGLRFVGEHLDRDNDGNSLWPGRDPDDGDPCVRKDFKCEPNALPPLYAPASLRRIRPLRNNLILFTVDGILPEDLPDRGRSLPEPGRVGRFYGSTAAGGLLLLPADSSPRSLRAYFQDLSGVEERVGRTEPSLFSLASLAGYRTICGGSGSYLGLESEWKLDRGCQVFRHLEDEEGSGPDVSRTVRLVRREMSLYREEKNLLWIHYTRRKGEKSETSGRELLEVLEKKLLKGDGVLLVFLDPDRSYYARVYRIGEGVRKGERPETFTSFRQWFLLAWTGSSRLPRRKEGPVVPVSLLSDRTGESPRRFPRRSCTPHKGGVRIFDGITGLYDDVRDGPRPRYP